MYPRETEVCSMSSSLIIWGLDYRRILQWTFFIESDDFRLQ